MSDFDLGSGLGDALVYLVFIALGVTLFLVGRKRGQETGGPFMKGLGVVLVLVFGLAAIPNVLAFVDRSSADSPSGAQSTTTTTTTGPSQTETVNATTSTTTTTLPAKYWLPSDDAIAVWAAQALDFVESQDWHWETTQKGLDAMDAWARITCGRLSGGFNSDPQTPAQTEAVIREGVGIEAWQVYGSVVFDDLVHGLCIRR
jgi:hypothetical protein